MSAGLFSRKSVAHLKEQAEEPEHGFRRVLGPVNLVSLGVGGIIGAGIFVLTGQAAAQYAGPAIVISFLISGIGCAFSGLCYAEMASMIPVAGSAYTYAYATLGEIIAWIIGWDLILEYLFGAATVAVGWSGYVVSFLKDLGITVPKALAAAPVDVVKGHWQMMGMVNLPAVFIVVLATILLVIGIRESANTNNIIVFTKIAVLILFVAVALPFINLANWHPFIPPQHGGFGHFGWSGVLRGAGVIFFAYIGFDAVSTTAQEARRPQKDMPIGILGSLAISTVLYIVVSLVLTGVISYTKLMVPDPLAVATDSIGPQLFWMRPIIKLGAIAGLSSVVLILLMGQPRVFFSMARDGLLPPAFARVHPRFRTPYVTTITTGILAAVVAGLFPIGILGELVSIGTLMAFMIVCLGVLVLRFNHPEIPRTFRTPWVPVVPILGAAICLLQMVMLPLDTWVRLIVWMIIGIIIYSTYGYRHSHARIRPETLD